MMFLLGHRKTDRMRIQLRFCGFSEGGAPCRQWHIRPRKLIQGMEPGAARLGAARKLEENLRFSIHCKALAIMRLV